MKLLATTLAALVLAGSAFATSAWDGHIPRGCVRLLPKGNGTVVNGVPVPLYPGQVLLSCGATQPPPPPPDH